jgi:hypothetical protein
LPAGLNESVDIGLREFPGALADKNIAKVPGIDMGHKRARGYA